MLVFVSFILGGYSESVRLTVWGAGAIVLSVAVFVTAFYMLMQDFWSAER